MGDNEERGWEECVQTDEMKSSSGRGPPWFDILPPNHTGGEDGNSGAFGRREKGLSTYPGCSS